VGTFWWISILEAEFALSNETMDDLTKDVEVSVVKAIMLVCATRLHHGHVEMELWEKLLI
jgi:hypothetical protein